MMDIQNQLADALFSDSQTAPIAEQPVEEQENTEEIAEEQSNETPQEEAQGDEVPELKYFNDLIQAAEVEPEWAYNRVVKVNGPGDTPEEITISRLVNERAEMLREKARLDQEKSKLDAEVRAAAQQQAPNVTPELQHAYGQLQAIQQQYNLIDQNPDMDPGEKANAKISLGTAYQQAQQHIQQVQQNVQQQQQQAYQEAMKRRNEAIVQSLPGWREQRVMEEESKAIYEYAGRFGLTPQDIVGTPDPRVILMLRDAAMLSTKQQAASTAGKKVRQAPKVVGANARQQQNSDQIVKSLRNRAMSKDASKRDKELAIGALLKQSGIF